VTTAVTLAGSDDPTAGSRPLAGPGQVDAELGQQLDEFRLGRLLGQGAMGAVFAAHDLVLDRPVAVKILLGRAASHRRFLLEARALARLDHPNVVRLYRAATSADGQAYLVQELVRGTTLDRVPTPLPARRLAEVLRALADGLAAAHRLGVLHRDVKPANAMVTDDGGVKLLDFGVAAVERHEPGALVDGDATGTGARVGTPRYLAPECWRGGAASARSDVWSLGVAAYELAAGHPPFRGDDLAALELAVCDGPPPAPLPLPPPLAALIARCLDREPEARPTPVEVAAHAAAYLADAPAPHGGAPYPGLAAFDDQRQADFFGRAGDVAIAVARLASGPAVTITGDSGVGKSSLCRAGVIPALRAGAPGRVIVLVPGRRPAQALRRALGLADDADLEALAPVVAAEAIVCVDQLEELVTLADPAEAAAAARALAALAAPEVGARLLFAVRGDHLIRVGGLPGLGPVVMAQVVVLRPLARADLREAVLAPARVRGLTVRDPDAVEAVIAPVVADPTALPLLQFALAAAWAERAGDVLDLAAIVRAGGLPSAFAAHADRVLAGLDGEQRAAARRLVLACVEERHRVSRTAEELCAGVPGAAAALEALVAGRLLIARDQPGEVASYTLVHEALIDRWPRLRGWLDERTGEAGLRARLRQAADDWHRHGRERGRLWPRASLATAADLDGLPATERAFLDASRRAARRTRAAWLALVAALPLTAGLVWGGLTARAEGARRAERDATVAGHRAAAEPSLRAARVALAEARARRTQALAEFAVGAATAEATWAEQSDRVRAARAALADASVALETALTIAPRDRLTIATLAEVVDGQATIAEWAHDEAAVADRVARLLRLEPDGRGAAWRAPAELAIAAPGARALAVVPVVERAGRAELGAPLATAAGPALRATVPAGSYVITVTRADRADERRPLVVTRGQRLDLALPPPPLAPAGFVYVAAGEFVTGSRYDDAIRRDFFGASPERVAATGAYFIARHEVTFADWMVYLRSLSPAERERRRPHTAAGQGMAIHLEGVDRFTLTLQPGAVRYRVAEGEPLIYPERTRRARVVWERLPVSGVSFHDAAAYAAWLDATGRVPRARLCTADEWERAARGADGRSYPHGARLEPDDANHDVTYDRAKGGWGPDEVGAHPASDSVFGVADLVGNVWEWARDGDRAVLRGGGWAHGAFSALSVNRDVNPPTGRYAWAGLRMCADVS
jgi:formylglycine-generating enzyme required for sulfatase activity